LPCAYNVSDVPEQITSFADAVGWLRGAGNTKEMARMSSPPKPLCTVTDRQPFHTVNTASARNTQSTEVSSAEITTTVNTASSA